MKPKGNGISNLVPLAFTPPWERGWSKEKDHYSDLSYQTHSQDLFPGFSQAREKALGTKLFSDRASGLRCVPFYEAKLNGFMFRCITL